MKPLESFEGSYDIPLEDLKRYRKLPPEEILRWLEEINNLTLNVNAQGTPESKLDSDSTDKK